MMIGVHWYAVFDIEAHYKDRSRQSICRYSRCQIPVVSLNHHRWVIHLPTTVRGILTKSKEFLRRRWEQNRNSADRVWNGGSGRNPTIDSRIVDAHQETE
jgi:hypothetical protein